MIQNIKDIYHDFFLKSALAYFTKKMKFYLFNLIIIINNIKWMNMINMINIF
jgi:hypothetical protein